MNAKILAVILIFVANFRLCESRRYDNYTLYSVVPKQLDQLRFLQNMDKQKYIDVIFCTKPSKLHDIAQVIVNPIDKGVFLERARHFGMGVILQSPNIQEYFDNQHTQKYLRLREDSYSWEAYHSLDDIYQWLSDLALQYPTIVELSSIGKSVEGRDIYAISIKRSGAKGSVLVEGGVHGNEWISTEFVTYLIDQVVHMNKTKNKLLIRTVKLYHWYLVPVVNPDGYVFSHREDRLWRKNRRNLGSVYGVDLNRNFDHSFGKFSSSTDTESDNYCGPKPFSEPESKAFADYVMKISDNLKYYFSIHAYGQKLIIPYADRVNHMENYGEMENYAKQAILKMYKLNGVKYSVGTTYDTLGIRISGSSASWVKKNYEVKYVYTFLLRDDGSFGHALPPNQILPTCQEGLTGILEIMTARPKKLRSRNIFDLSGQVRANLNRFLYYFVFLLMIYTF